MEICYKRVSTVEQNVDRQLHGMKFDKEYIEKISAKDINRPKLNEMLAQLREGDSVHVHELSRLARNTKDLLEVVEKILSTGSSIIFHKENLNFTAGENRSAVQDLMLSLLATIAQFERDLLLERQREGISLAKQRGVYKGKQSRFTKQEIEKIKEDFAISSNKAKLAKRWGISRAYLYKLAA